jgi:hypothetical protein
MSKQRHLISRSAVALHVKAMSNKKCQTLVLLLVNTR